MEMDEDFFKEEIYYKDLYYTTKGKEQCAPNHSFGPTVREYFLIHIIMKGKGYFEIGNSRFNLKEGQFFIIYPNVMTYYQADEEDPWEYARYHCGTAANIYSTVHWSFVAKAPAD